MSTVMTERTPVQSTRRSPRSEAQLHGASDSGSGGASPASRSARVWSMRVRAILSAVLVVLAGVVVFAAPVLRVIEAKLCVLLMGVVGDSATFVTVHGEPGIAYQMSGSWLALPATVHLTGVFAVAGLLVVAAAAMWLPQLARLRRVSSLQIVTAAAASVVGAVIVFQVRLLVLAGIWASGGIAAFHGAAVWLTVVTYAVAALAALGSYAVVVVRAATRGAARH